MGSKRNAKKKRKKPPVLTSPWKIGMFVALMLLVTGSGVGYYFVRMYDIGLTWLGPDKSTWIVDSYGFFRETYPVAAGMVVMSLFTYFMIASAVRRYRYYLDSGQDYRRMVSLAESIDDLTNPAQIARLSDYPELQNVLRNYGDQIREISAEINERQDESRPVDLAMEIDSILKGNPATESLIDGKWWAPIVRKVETAMKERAEQSGGADRQQADAMRRSVSRAALACGRIMESAAVASEEIAGIAGDAGRLVAVSRGAQQPAPRARASTDGIVEQVGLLEQVRATLAGFSEQNNGLALNIALMAARGNVDERQLAQYAENVRMTAERFGALGKDLDGIALGISKACREFMAQPGAASFTADPSLASLAEGIERRSRLLMERVASLVEDAEEIGSAVRSAGGDPEQQTARVSEPAADDSLRIESADGKVEEHMIVNFGTESQPSDAPRPGDSLVIDHGGSWNAREGSESPRSPERQPKQAPRVETGPDDCSLKISGLAESLAAEHAAAQAEQASPAGAGATAAPGRTGDWMEMPGHRWVKVDAACGDTAARTTVHEHAGAAAPAESGSRGPSDAEEEPVYDLYELGAVECLEETEATL
ncbi:MAG: hypothetical protein PHQ19_07415 [Candidatus Krumholzibacteria bacterium]|nr:hypothetical protein [Candidatus Krumholzibacteria bacterium]